MFGLSSWSLLLPQSVMGVLSVYLLYRMVQKRLDATTGLLAGTFLAVIPVSTVIFRYNNPDALLTLLMIGILYCTLESVDNARVRWLLLAGALTGAAFLTKQLQVLVVLPGIAVAYGVFARVSVAKRLLHLLTALATAAIAAGWWLAVVQMTSPADRPFIGGSRNNSAVELTLGYNGLDRLTGEDATRTMSPGINAGLTEKLDAGFQRFLQPQFSGQFGWFLPLAVAGLCIGAWLLWRRQGEPAQRALLLICSVWFSCSATVLAFMSGILHPYYVLTAVPPLCCLAAVALMRLLRGLDSGRIRLFAAGIFAATMVVAFITAVRSTADFPGFPVAVLVIWSLAIAGILLRPPGEVVTRVVRIFAILALLLGPVLWSLNTVLSSHIGAGVVAGPSIFNMRTDDRDRASPETPQSYLSVMFGDSPNSKLLQRLQEAPPERTWTAAVVGSETAANYQLESGRAVLPLGGFDGTDPFPTLEQFQGLLDEGRVQSVVIENLPPLTLEGRGESARIVDWVKENFSAEQVGGAEYYRLVR
ncbi:glycosyltransferase family 39 protein [Arthrobacter sp. 24S4-2]|uniref:glycosyltransferase family 39 protein n=1 Tax=Arthrobacter sp. 24S4-2 TaxID=2575374 RepID=UPI0020C7FC61|nr:glycosyltransferase family 39 protein [Arthrobacter sp. 24S4-2]